MVTRATNSDSALAERPRVGSVVGERRRWVVLGLLCLFVVGLVAGVYGLAEWGLHLRRNLVAASIADPPQDDPRFVADGLLRRRNRPSYSWTSTSPAGETRNYTNNSQGFRGPEIAANKPSGRVRVIVVGGSTVYGALDDDADTLSVQLAGLLQARLGPNVEVINAGVPGYYALSEAIATRRDLLALAPDVLIDLDGLNDVFYGVNPEWPSQMAEDQLHLIHAGGYQDMVDAIDRTMFPRGLLEHQASMVWRNLDARLGATDQHAANPRVVDLHAAVLGLLAGDASRAGVPAIVALQPLLVTGAKPIAPEERAAVDSGGYWTPDFLEPLARSMYPAMAASTRASVEAAGGQFLDLRGVFDADTGATYAEDAAHYTALGNRRLAEALLPVVVRTLSAPGVTTH
jgi:lysophospholipase L1-like esterase